MEIEGTLINILPLQSGVGRNGNEWKKQDIIIQTDDNYPKAVCISLWGDLTNESLKQGDKAHIQFNLESREFNGKWYTDVKAWKIELMNGSERPSNVSETKAPLEISDDDVLPF